MKKLISTIAIIYFSFSAVLSQYHVEENPGNSENMPRIFYLGGSGGINNNCGIAGLTAEIPLNKGFTLNGGLGIGLWGIKTAAGIRYYGNYPLKVYHSISFTSATEMSDVPYGNLSLQNEEEPDEERKEEKAEPTVDYLRANNIAIAIGYQWKVFFESRMNVEIGYSFPLAAKPYKIDDRDNVLTDETKDSIHGMVPGGIVISLGLTLGIY